jgi:hypothetical protein
VQAHKAGFNGRFINAAPAPFRPARLSVRVRAEDVKEKAEKAGEKAQEKAGQAVSKATGKVRHCHESSWSLVPALDSIEQAMIHLCH